MPDFSFPVNSGTLMQMEDARDKLIEAIQSSGRKAALAIAGGGSGAVHALMSHPGASRFVLEVQMPYTAAAMRDYLGEEPQASCSEEAAILLSERAYERAMIFTLPVGDDSPIMGVACTAALKTTRERKGADRAWLAVRMRRKQEVRKLELEAGTRQEQEEAVSAALLAFIAELLGVEE
jgi:hypothetical protein